MGGPRERESATEDPRAKGTRKQERGEWLKGREMHEDRGREVQMQYKEKKEED